jgi:PAS domain S-box-containing protein
MNSFTTPSKIKGSFAFTAVFVFIVTSGTILFTYVFFTESTLIKSKITEQCNSLEQIIIPPGTTPEGIDSCFIALLRTNLNASFRALQIAPYNIYSYSSITVEINKNDSVISVSTPSSHSIHSNHSWAAHTLPYGGFLNSTCIHFHIPPPWDLNSEVLIQTYSEQPIKTIFSFRIPMVQWYHSHLKICVVPVFITIISILSFFLVFQIPIFSRFFSEVLFPEALYTFIIGFHLTLLFTFFSLLNEARLRSRDFDQLSKLTATSISGKLSDVSDFQFEAFSRFFENSDFVSRSEFNNYTSYLSNDYKIRAWGWISCVDSSNRKDFEEAMQKDGFSSFYVVNNTFSSDHPVNSNATFFPITYIAPAKSNEVLIGVDITSDTTFIPLVNYAIKHNKTITSQPIPFSLLGDTTFYAFVFHPIFDEDSISHPNGLTFLMIDYASLLHHFGTTNSYANQDVSVSMYEVPHDNSTRFLASTSGDNVIIFNQPSYISHPLFTVHPFSCFGTTYVLTTSPQKHFLHMHPLKNHKFTFLGCLFTTLILAMLFGSLKYHKVSLEHQVLERTAALKESDERFSQITEHCREMIWETDANGLYTYVSKASSTILGYTEDELIGKYHIYDLCPVEDREKSRTRFFELFEKHAPIHQLTSTVITKEKNVVHFLTNAVPVIDENGVLKAYRGSNLDITEQTNAANERQKLQGELAQSQKMDSIGRLAGGIAHDFNNMLTAIMCNADVALNMSDTDENAKAPLTEILHSARRSADLTKQLLAFARKQEIKPAIINLNDTITAMLKMLQRLIGENISLSWQPAPVLWNVLLDKSQADQILTNLVVNARDAINEIGHITISTANIELTEPQCNELLEGNPGKYVVLTVCDSGCGMDQKTLSHIFEPFFTTKVQGQGTGLGLATVYGITKQNNGFIRVQSELSKGTSFYLYLPRYEGEVPADATHVKEPARGSNEAILIVEDEKSILLTAKTILERAGYKVLTASTPEVAIDIAKSNNSICVLLSDVILPGMNGKELSTRITELLPHIKIIFMSGYAANAISHQGILYDSIGFLQKPFTRFSLLEKVRNVLDA